MNRQQLAARAAVMAAIRRHFEQTGLVEVTTPQLLGEVIPEAHIDPVEVRDPVSGLRRFLQASPELALKQLVATGVGAVFEFAHAFRHGELGALHRPEFTMLEWYVPGDDLAAGIDRLSELVAAVSPWPRCQCVTYAEAFGRVLGLDPHRATAAELAACGAQFGLTLSAELASDRDEWLNLLLATQIEPTLGRDAPEVVTHYPVSQGALAQVSTNAAGQPVAERFELYYRGVELANGYHELADVAELRRRFTVANELRTRDGRSALPLPEQWLRLLTTNPLPPTTGVALGLDRLVMLLLGESTLAAAMVDADQCASDAISPIR